MAKSRSALRDLLNRVVASYNKDVTIRRHRIDSGRKALIYNLLHGSKPRCSFTVSEVAGSGEFRG